MPHDIANAVSVFLQITVFLIGVYYLAIGFFSLFSPPVKKGNGDCTQFAVVIPAHNEAGVLGDLLRSLQTQDYPASHLHVFVAADRCTDCTEQIAAAWGASVLVIQNPDNAGKGFVLASALSLLHTAKEHYDAFAVLDADNIANPRFFAELNEALQSGASAVQGYIDTKNPNDSWISHSYALWYWISNRMLQMGYHRLGLGCSLGGTGFALSHKLLDEIPWQTHTLAEDAEYTAQLTLGGKKICYVPRAVVYDEKPTSFSVSLHQRMRWTQGITQVQRDYGGKMLRRGQFGGFLRFWSNLLMPLCFLLLLLLDAAAIHQLWYGKAAAPVSFWAQPLTFLLLNFYLLGMLFCILLGLVRDRKWNAKTILHIPGLFAYLISWIPTGILGALCHTEKEWYHTAHKSK